MERTGIRIDPAQLGVLSQPHGHRDAAACRTDPCARRQAVQHQLAAATGEGPVRGSEAARAGEVRQGQNHLDRGRHAGGARGGTRDRAPGAGIPATCQAEGHLCRCAARSDSTAIPGASTRPSIRPARRPAGCPRPIRICRTSRSGPNSAARSARPSCRATAGCSWSPTTRRSNCGCWRTCRRTRCW